MFKCVIFDVDGTLIDTLETIYILCCNTLARFGLRPLTKEEYNPLFGLGARDLTEGILDIVLNGDRSMSETVHQEMVTRYYDNPISGSKPFNGIPEMVNELLRKEVTLAVLTNKPQNILNRMIEEFFKPDSFARCVGHSGNMPLKPDPSTLIALIDELGYKPHECVYVGDTPIDIQTAKGAGAYSIGVLWGLYGKKTLIQSGADMAVNTPDQITALFA